MTDPVFALFKSLRVYGSEAYCFECPKCSCPVAMDWKAACPSCGNRCICVRCQQSGVKIPVWESDDDETIAYWGLNPRRSFADPFRV